MDQFPPIDPIRSPPTGDALVSNAFIECGLCMSDGYGKTPISWQEIRAYANGKLLEWECRMIRKMSEEYCKYVAFGSQNRHAKPPYQPELTEDDMLERAKLMEKMI